MNSFFRKYACALMLASSLLVLADSFLPYWACACPDVSALEQKKGTEGKEDKGEQKEENEKKEKDEKEKNKYLRLNILLSELSMSKYAGDDSALSQLPSEIETPPPKFS